MDATQVVSSNNAQQAAGPVGLRRAFATVGAVAPGLASWVAERMWFTPPRPRISKEARGLLERGAPLAIAVDGRRVSAWTFGTGNRVVALMHGWGGYAGQLAPFIAPLVEAGFRVVTFDALAHGGSEASRAGARLSTFFDFAGGLSAIQEQVGPLHAIVAHSGGAIATGIALRKNLDVARLVMIAPMTRPKQYATVFSHVLGLSPAVRDGWQARALRRIGVTWEELDVTREQTPRRPLLVVHDLEDKEVPFADGEALAASWPDAELHSVSGLGHRRLLRDAAVISRSLEFLTRP